jgi:hypothetical protein
MTSENYGVWGGLLTKERNALKTKQDSPLRKKAVEELQQFGLSIEQIEAITHEYQNYERSLANKLTNDREDDSPRNR